MHDCQNVSKSLNIVMFNGRAITDHINGKAACLAVAECLRLKLLDAFTSKTEKSDMFSIHWSYYFEHKIDNLCKEACIGQAK